MPSPATSKLKGSNLKKICGPGTGRRDANGDVVRTNGPDPTGGATQGKAVRPGNKSPQIRKKAKRKLTNT